MSVRTGAPVVVGVDGSPTALRAVRTGAAEAALRHRPLHLVHAFVWPLLHVDVDRSPGGPTDGGLRHQAERMLAEAVGQARAVAPGLPVSHAIVDGQAAAVLCRETTDADLLVIGDRGLGGFTGLLVGSVAVQVSTYASCPVLLARGEDHDGPVVVGVDNSAHSRVALGVAIEEASRRGAECRAVHAFRHPVSSGPGDMMPLVYDTEALRGEEDRELAESIAGWSDRFPDVPVIRRVVHGRAAPALIEESATAQLVVVGARGLGGFAGLLLGSTSHAVLHHAGCPTVLVRDGNAPGQGG
ncbi:universal stress protein [Micromonospora zhanjiangensis]|uniref:Universal stress protein n=1 Tax=Micromonospora zhanjiangensis TaxID=1522057 RepID=A0ABV8KW09_9ACTN